MFLGLVDWPDLLHFRNGPNYTKLSTHRLKVEKGAGADVCVGLQKEAVLIVIKLAYLSKCQEELRTTVQVIKLGCLGWS